MGESLLFFLRSGKQVNDLSVKDDPLLKVNPRLPELYGLLEFVFGAACFLQPSLCGLIYSPQLQFKQLYCMFSKTTIFPDKTSLNVFFKASFFKQTM